MIKFQSYSASILLLCLSGGGAWSQAPQAAASETPVSADLITRADALKLVEVSLASCEGQGERIAAFVTDADGHLRAALSSDGAHPIGLRSAALKTATVLQFKASTKSLAERLRVDATFADKYGNDARYMFHPGAMAIHRHGKFVAVLALGGGHDKDESCALEALKSLSWVEVNP
jgi:uncharacterized protein GlcG (DUF336 family)